jgi:predicted NUDIX family NTP pyrophosphohydrolase
MTRNGKQSAGILAYRMPDGILEVFLVHPGGPFWVKKDIDAWTIPKGEFDGDENPLDAAKREFLEETGIDIFEKDMKFTELSAIRQKSGKWVHAWACESDFDAQKVQSNTFSIEWPPKSGKMAEFPEVDKGAWFLIKEAKEKIKAAQIPLIEQLMDLLETKETLK